MIIVTHRVVCLRVAKNTPKLCKTTFSCSYIKSPVHTLCFCRIHTHAFLSCRLNVYIKKKKILWSSRPSTGPVTIIVRHLYRVYLYTTGYVQTADARNNRSCKSRPILRRYASRFGPHERKSRASSPTNIMTVRNSLRTIRTFVLNTVMHSQLTLVLIGRANDWNNYNFL